MSAETGARDHPSRRRLRVKSGCSTCRIRKIKCDEIKPFCRKCTSTGRTCDGYESPFRFHRSRNGVQDGDHHNAVAYRQCSSLQPILAAPNTITEQDIRVLNRCFSVKTVFEVKLECDMEAKQVLEAGLTDPSIQHAITALKSLRQDFERSRESTMSVSPWSPSYDYGLGQYCAALKAVTSSRLAPSQQGLRSTLLCCQVFICIEQVQQNYDNMARHLIQGLNIMHQFRARPCLDANGNLIPAHDAPLPLLDVFLIKMFSAPCKFADASVLKTTDEDASSSCPIWDDQRTDSHRSHRTILPDMRAGLTKVAASTLEFLNKVSNLQIISGAIGLLSEKASLQRSLDSWVQDLSNLYPADMSPDTELISVSFMRLFHQTLQIIVLGALETAPHHTCRLNIESDKLQDIARKLGDRLMAYRLGETPH